MWHLQAFAQPKSRTLQGAIGRWRSSGSLPDLTLRLLKLHLCTCPPLGGHRLPTSCIRLTFTVAMRLHAHSTCPLPIYHRCSLIRCRCSRCVALTPLCALLKRLGLCDRQKCPMSMQSAQPCCIAHITGTSCTKSTCQQRLSGALCCSSRAAAHVAVQASQIDAENGAAACSAVG